jgi:inner membrane protein
MEPADNPYLNRRKMGYVGRTFTLKEPIVDGRGRLTIEDTVWEIEGPDLSAGARVKVTAVSGMSLIVEPL